MKLSTSFPTEHHKCIPPTLTALPPSPHGRARCHRTQRPDGALRVLVIKSGSAQCPSIPMTALSLLSPAPSAASSSLGAPYVNGGHSPCEGGPSWPFQSACRLGNTLAAQDQTSRASTCRCSMTPAVIPQESEKQDAAVNQHTESWQFCASLSPMDPEAEWAAVTAWQRCCSYLLLTRCFPVSFHLIIYFGCMPSTVGSSFCTV